ncbi:MAG: hypothetical protein GY806_22520, partial [Gammaproteobacteria bacterium]|nr:hypothetical protein [Gammaproteobacteria bacterium]
MSRKPAPTSYKSDLIVEELEVRQLFSGGIEGLIDTSLLTTSYLEEDKDNNQASSEETSAESQTAAETQSHEIVFVDTAVKDYQSLVDDLI